MEIKVLLLIDGVNFSPQEFDENLPDHLKGEILAYSSIARKAKTIPQYWMRQKSYTRKEIIQHIDNFKYEMDLLYDLLWEYKDILSTIATNTEIDKSASIWVNFDDPDEIRGYCFEKKMIELCHQLDIEIDIAIGVNLD